MILFLDFDGVLHPSPSGEQGIFCHLERLEAILRVHSTINIVVSSSWRLTYPEDVIVGIFARDIQNRIIGMTPEIKGDVQYPRHAEIVAWLDEAAYRGPWIALDDAANEFPKSCANLLLCEASIGFDSDLAHRLDALLRKLPYNLGSEPLQSANEMIQLREYPTLARLAASRTSATRLDVRAVRFIYSVGLAGIDPGTIGMVERVLIDRIGLELDGTERRILT